MTKRALVTGVTGQDGSYLAELLLDKGYEVYGLIRPGATRRTQNIDHLLEPVERVHRIYGDLGDSASLRAALDVARPDEVYNLGAQAHVRYSFDLPEYTGQATALGAMRLLEAIRTMGLSCRFYQASSSELFGKVAETPQRETTPFYPRSPYACAKAYAYYATVNYREAYGMFAVNGILYNHESPRRGPHYVTRKVSLSVARIKAGLQHELRLGNLDAKRDWGYAPEYVEGMWRMLQHDEPGDYVLATGQTHSVQDLVERAFARVGLDWTQYVVRDERFLRPTEVDLLLGDPARAKAVLGWQPTTTFGDLVDLMVDADMAAVGSAGAGPPEPGRSAA